MLILKQLFNKYKFPALVSLVLSVLIIALRVESKPFNIVLIILGSFLGTFILDLDYIFYTYMVDPQHFFSKNVAGFIRNRSVGSALLYIEHHKKELRNLPLHNILFQASLVVLCFYTVISTQSLFGKALILSTLLQSFFEEARDFAEDKNLDNWFWVLRNKPTSKVLIGYFMLMGILFLYSLSLV